MIRTVLISLCFFCSLTSAQSGVLHEDFALLASDAAENDRFGIKVSISGDRAIVGAYNHDDNGEDSGAAYIYNFNGDQWVEEAELLASDGAANDEFGLTVSISGTTAIVGAHSVDDNGEDSGAVYIYRLAGGQWVEEAKLLASDGEPFDNFGLRVNISGDTAIVGAYMEDENGSDSGSAYVFRFNGKYWIEEAKLLASDGSGYDHFGRAVSISGDTAIVGSRLDDDNGDDSGSAYIYRFNGKQWVEEVKLLASDGKALDNFGHSVSISGDRVIVGARHGNIYNSGAAYIFRFNGASWIEETVLVASDGSTLDEFGHSVSISGDLAIVGAGGDDDLGTDSGSTYMYRFFDGEWVRTKLHASDGESGDTFGLTVSISGTTAIVGSRSHDGTAINSGSAYVYNFGNFWTVDDDAAADFDSIQAAIYAANDGDLIVVRAGTYVEHTINTLGKAIVIRGTTGETGELVSIVDANSMGSVFVCNTGETASTVLKNLVITGGSAFSGGGVYIEASSPSLVGCTITNNQAPKGFGGGICIIDGLLSLVDCTFIGNIGGVGGGVYNQPEYDTAHEVRGCLFQDNHAVNGNYGHGGGLKHGSGFMQVADCSFIDNTASGGGGGMSEFASGGIHIDNCNFIGNSAQGGGGLDTNGIGECIIVSSSFIGNQSTTYGGGIQSGSPHLALFNCRLSNNVTSWLGGAVMMLYADQQPAMFVNCMIDNNTTYAGATVSVQGTVATEFINTSIVNNFGSGLSIVGWVGQYLKVHNTLIWGNEPISISVEGEIDVDVRYSNIEGGWAGDGNINANPLLIFKNGEVMLDPDSSCIDYGSDLLLPNDELDLDGDGDTFEVLPVDFFGNNRIGGLMVDIGAVEFHAPTCTGDLNGDSIVNVTDLLAVIDQWGESNSPADLNDDGIVDVTDLLIVVGAWGPCI